MKAGTKQCVSIAMSLAAALSIIASAYFLKDTQYEDLWVYVMSAWLIAHATLEVLTRESGDR